MITVKDIWMAVLTLSKNLSDVCSQPNGMLFVSLDQTTDASGEVQSRKTLHDGLGEWR